jgi:hypothetical protein
MSLLPVIYWLILLIVWGIAIIRYKKLTPPFKILTWAVLVTFLLTITSKFYSQKYKENYPIQHLECISGYIFYALIYYHLFKNVITKKLILISIGVVCIFFVINMIFLQPFNSMFPSNVSVLTQALYTVFSLLLFKEMLSYPLSSSITKQSIFWYNTAVLIYATTMFFIFGLTNYFVKSNFSDNSVFYLWYFILYIFHILIGISILTDNKEITSNNARQ